MIKGECKVKWTEERKAASNDENNGDPINVDFTGEETYFTETIYLVTAYYGINISKKYNCIKIFKERLANLSH